MLAEPVIFPAGVVVADQGCRFSDGAPRLLFPACEMLTCPSKVIKHIKFILQLLTTTAPVEQIA